MDRQKLEGLTREELVALAGELGIVRPRSLTVPELIDEIVSRTAANERDKARSRGWLGRARSLLASVIERGLHLPDVAKALRNAPSTKPWPVAPTPLATMTLAEIYAAQGFLDKALQILDEIITREPEHADARSLRQRLQAQSNGGKKAETPAKREETVAPAVVETAKRASAPEVVEPEAEASPQVVETNVPPVTLESETAAPVEVAAVAASADVVAAPAEEAKNEEIVASVAETGGEEAAEAAEDSATDSFDDEPAALDSDWHDEPAIEELPLPERYNVDEIVGIAVDPGTVYVYWEVRPVVLARAHARASGGTMVVRLVSVTPTWDGPIVEQRDLRIDALYGDAYVRGIQPGSNVRIGVGWLAHGEFTPFAIGEPVTTPRKERAAATASTVGRWMPEGASAAVASGQTTVNLLAMALEKAVAKADVTVLVSPKAPSAERTSLGLRQQWPTFDLGSRGMPAQSTQRASRSNLGGSSELNLGGASEQVRHAG